tara:strand:- start:409 stop:576 length:168 start_codon:yes stop_codon:yes gene_type:complete
MFLPFIVFMSGFTKAGVISVYLLHRSKGRVKRAAADVIPASQITEFALRFNKIFY